MVPQLRREQSRKQDRKAEMRRAMGIDSNNAKSLSKKILKVLSMDEASLQSIGKEGRKNIIQKFNVEKMCFSTYSEYKRILN